MYFQMYCTFIYILKRTKYVLFWNFSFNHYDEKLSYKKYCLNIVLCFRKNAEKIIYFLLLDRKRRKPSKKDDENSLLYPHASGKTLFSYIVGFLIMLILRLYGRCWNHWRVIIITLTILILWSSITKVNKISEMMKSYWSPFSLSLSLSPSLPLSFFTHSLFYFFIAKFCL